jgi:CRP-like cAMP-binding protein
MVPDGQVPNMSFQQKGEAMIIQKADLFKDQSQETMNEIAKVMVEESHEKGSLVFKAGTPANHFYILVDGRVRVSIGTEAEIDYTVNLPGEAFGWTGMVDRPVYVASAECVAPSKVVKIQKESLNKIFEKHPQMGMMFFKRLAGAVVQRLIYNYETFLSEGSLKGVSSFGTGQVTDTSPD